MRRAAGESTSADPHGDAYLLWVALHGMATLEKPARDDYLRLGPLDRAAVVGTLIERLARLTSAVRRRTVGTAHRPSAVVRPGRGGDPARASVTSPSSG